MSAIYKQGTYYGVAALPDGGSKGQALVKKTNANGDVEWSDVAAALPTGGTTGQALIKRSNSDQDVEWGDVSGETIQMAIMPAASSSELGNIYQFIGITDANYTNGYFYKCVSDGTAYAWEQIDVQPPGGRTFNAMLLAANWSSKQQIVTFTGYDDSLGGVIGVPHSATIQQKSEYASCKINLVSQSGISFTFSCETVPTIDLPVTLYSGGGVSATGGSGIPDGGTTGQALVKKSNIDQDVEWGNVSAVPDGGTTGQALVKKSNTDKDVEWGTVSGVPDGGTTGQALVKKSNTDKDVEWGNVSGSLPSGGTTGQALVKKSNSDGDVEWNSVSGSLPSGGTTGQALVKKSNSDNDVEWGNVSVTVDNAISDSSENPVQNKVIKSALDAKADLVGGKVPSAQLPSYVDDVIEGYYKSDNGKFYEESTYTTEITGESGKIYVSLDTGYEYRWSGSAFVQIGGTDANTVSRSLTRAQYESLSTAEKNNGTIYYITDMVVDDPALGACGFTPIGTIISVMGIHAPENYLACDGTVYNIADYPELANYFKDQFGVSNKFGGDGTTTFAVPDLQGEFLRGTGTNSHELSGDGSSVGEHQSATQIPYFNTGYNTSSGTKDTFTFYTQSDASSGSYNSPGNVDKLKEGPAYARISTLVTESKGTSDLLKASALRVRPTNTSVLFCIAYKNIYVTTIDERDVYSTDEKIVGQWLDGSPLYQQSFTVASLNGDSTVTHGIDNLGVVVDVNCIGYWTAEATWEQFNNINPYCFVNAITIEIGSEYAMTDVHITIKYTKSTGGS